MTLAPGATLGSYRILGPLGAGGMGEVYRAQDTKLKREVAIKVLPDLFTHDELRKQRFEREAHVLASLNHPHIAAIYGPEHTDGVTALVLELVEGRTLAERIDAGAIPLEEALLIARQVAQALEAAHDKGIVHRDAASETPVTVAPRPRRRWGVIAFAAAVLIGVLAFEAGRRSGDAPHPSFRRLTFRRGSVFAARFAPDGTAGSRPGARLAGRPRWCGRTPCARSSSPPGPARSSATISTVASCGD